MIHHRIDHRRRQCPKCEANNALRTVRKIGADKLETKCRCCKAVMIREYNPDCTRTVPVVK